MHNDLPPLFVHPSSGIPIYRQLMDQFQALISSGRLKPGDLLPSVRQVSSALEINMMTVSKAFARLEQEGVVERVRGTGMRVAENSQRGNVAERQQALREHAESFVTRGLQLGLTNEQMLAVVHSVQKERRP